MIFHTRFVHGTIRLVLLSLLASLQRITQNFLIGTMGHFSCVGYSVCGTPDNIGMPPRAGTKRSEEAREFICWPLGSTSEVPKFQYHCTDEEGGHHRRWCPALVVCGSQECESLEYAIRRVLSVHAPCCDSLPSACHRRARQRVAPEQPYERRRRDRD